MGAIDRSPAQWEGGKCQTPMFWGYGSPAGFCGKEALGPQLPREILYWRRGDNAPFCVGPCCPAHGGPDKGEPIVFQDGLTPSGRPMWCAVMPGFINLQESEAGFDGNAEAAVKKLRAAIARAEGGE